MPTYEYKCPAGHAFEKFYPTMNDSRRVKCPTCGKAAERQISGGAGLVFRGSGFYATDYKRAGETNEGEKKVGEKREDEKKEGEKKEGEKKAEAKAHSKKHSKDK
jgi:putative FmdB family regulatory protein